MSMRLRWIVAALPVFALIGLALSVWLWRKSMPQPPFTIADRVRALGGSVDARLQPSFHAAGVKYPPARVTLIALKEERRLELWAADGESGAKRLIKIYPVLAASGKPGPKLREGDRQVPEGIYGIEWLNPNSRFHLSMRLNYPNANDIARAQAEGRDVENLGSDIMIHGGAASIGCLAVGDPASEELFVLAARVGIDSVDVIVAPCDFRVGASVEIPDDAPAWTAELHDEIRARIGE